MTPLLALLARDLKLAVREGGGAALALGFFALVATLVPARHRRRPASARAGGGRGVVGGGGARGAAFARPAVPGRLRGWQPRPHRAFAASARRGGGGQDPRPLARHRPAAHPAVAAARPHVRAFRGADPRAVSFAAGGNARGERGGRHRGEPHSFAAPRRAHPAPHRACRCWFRPSFSGRAAWSRRWTA